MIGRKIPGFRPGDPDTVIALPAVEWIYKYTAGFGLVLGLTLYRLSLTSRMQGLKHIELALSWASYDGTGDWCLGCGTPGLYFNRAWKIKE